MNLRETNDCMSYRVTSENVAVANDRETTAPQCVIGLMVHINNKVPTEIVKWHFVANRLDIEQ